MYSSLAQAERGLTSISHGEELFGILTISLSTNALWGCQFQAQRDIAVRFNGPVATLSDGGSVGDVLTTGSIGNLSRDHVPLTSVFLTVTIVLLGTTEKVLRTAKREAAAASIVRGKNGDSSARECSDHRHGSRPITPA